MERLCTGKQTIQEIIMRDEKIIDPVIVDVYTDFV
jgi:hypothetical protein